MKKAIDMTGWIMSEHGVPDSRLTVIERAPDHVQTNGRVRVMWKCRCACGGPNSVFVTSADRIRGGQTKSCGCIVIERASTLNKKENVSDLSGKFGIILSTNTNEEIYFDLSDAEQILQHTWCVNNLGYPITHIDKKIITMHAFLGYMWPDHHNRNKLDNRRENLVSATRSENSKNMSKRKDNVSGYTGVYWNSQTNKWGAFIQIDGKTNSCGLYDNKNDAIVARLLAEAKYYGEFAPQRHLFESYGIQVDNIQDIDIVRPLRSDNSSGCTGVYWDNKNAKWCVEICVNKKKIYLGRFANKDDAICARLTAELEYYGEECAPQRHLFEEYLKTS